MIGDLSCLDLLWDASKEERCLSMEKNITVYHSIADVDSVCAVRILANLLNRESWQSSMYPVESYADLERSMQGHLQGSTEMRTVIFINCGATQCIRRLRDALDLQQVRCVVIDSHRPVHVDYNDPDDNEVIFVLPDDDPVSREDIPEGCKDVDEFELEAFEAEAQAEEEAEESDSDSNPAKRARTHEGASPSKPQWGARQKLAEKKERQRRLSEYYDLGSSYGKPASLIMLDLALKVNSGGNADLWPAMIGLTDQWVHQRTSSQHYEQWRQDLMNQMQLVEVNSRESHQRPTDSNGRERRGPVTTARIVAARDYRLMLLRHWNLYEAMQYSPYVAPRLQTWRENGRSQVQLMFAKMGLPLEQARMQFATTRPEYQDLSKLRDACKDTLVKFDELSFNSFELRWGYSWALSAADAVYVLSSILARHKGADPEDDEDPFDDFWDSTAALDVNTADGQARLAEGIEEAKKLQRAILNDGGMVISRRQVDAQHHMQTLDLTAVAPTNRDLFRHPLTLQRLAMFVRDAAEIARTRGNSRWPVVVIGPANVDGFCCVVGIRSRQLHGKPQYNVFGQAFRQAIEGAGSRVVPGLTYGFDDAVVCVHKADVTNFLAELQLLMDKDAEAAAKAKAAVPKPAAPAAAAAPAAMAAAPAAVEVA